MKILHINAFDTGGAAIAAIRLHKSLLHEGYDSNMLFSKITRSDVPNSFEFTKPEPSLSKNISYKIKRKLGGELNYWEKSNKLLQGRITGFDMFSLPFSDFRIEEQHIYKEADVINLHWTASLLDYKFFENNHKPLVWTLHDMAPFTGGCHYSRGCEVFMTNCTNCPQLIGTGNIDLANENLNYKQESLINKNIQVVTLSDWMTERVAQSKLFGQFNIKKILNSLDSKIFKPYPVAIARSLFSLPEDTPIILFVSESIENKRKGFDLLTACIDSFSDSNVLFCAVGASKQDGATQNKKVRHIGKVVDEYTLAMLYNAADVVVIPSREDNLPNVMLEALSCGTPVISFSNGGMKEIIVNEQNGVLVNTINESSLKNAIHDFLKNKQTFNKQYISDSAHKTFKNSIQVKAYTNLYKELLNNH
jgi:glycosyltransferase involved in cell wall biosynthesis